MEPEDGDTSWGVAPAPPPPNLRDYPGTYIPHGIPVVRQFVREEKRMWCQTCQKEIYVIGQSMADGRYLQVVQNDKMHRFDEAKGQLVCLGGTIASILEVFSSIFPHGGSNGTPSQVSVNTTIPLADIEKAITDRVIGYETRIRNDAMERVRDALSEVDFNGRVAAITMHLESKAKELFVELTKKIDARLFETISIIDKKIAVAAKELADDHAKNLQSVREDVLADACSEMGELVEKAKADIAAEVAKINAAMPVCALRVKMLPGVHQVERDAEKAEHAAPGCVGEDGYTTGIVRRALALELD